MALCLNLERATYSIPGVFFFLLASAFILYAPDKCFGK